MISDLNRVDLEGTVMFTPEVVEKDDKKAINFLIENCREGKNGIMKFRYNCVVWGTSVEKVQDRLKEGAYVRIRGHLQDNTLDLPDGKVFHYTKPCADYIEFLDN